MSNKNYEIGDLLAEISTRENPSYYLVIGAPSQEVSEDDGTYKLLSLDNEEISFWHCGWVNGRHWKKVA